MFLNRIIDFTVLKFIKDESQSVARNVKEGENLDSFSPHGLPEKWMMHMRTDSLSV
jgi:hypothetical protein